MSVAFTGSSQNGAYRDEPLPLPAGPVSGEELSAMLQETYALFNGFPEDSVDIDLYVYDRLTRCWFAHSWLYVSDGVDVFVPGTVEFIMHLRSKDIDDESEETIVPFWDNDDRLVWVFDGAIQDGPGAKNWANVVLISEDFVDLFNRQGLEIWKPDPRLPGISR
jgi:hypothetical protein